MSAHLDFWGARPSRAWVKASRFRELFSLKHVSARRRNQRRRRACAPEHRARVLRTGIAVVGLAGTVWLATPKPPLLDGITFSQCVRDRNGKLLRLTLSADQKFRIRTSLHDISPELIRATL